jgi:two-component system, sensor histidine kinase and response regulator
VEPDVDASEGRYRQLFEAESDAVLLFDNESGRVLEANAAACALYGYAPDELLTVTDLELSAEPEQTLALSRGAAAREGKAITIARRIHRRKDGFEFPVEISARWFTFQGRMVRIAAVRDVS